MNIIVFTGIMGFARVMPGDSFEVSIRHGSQKWKSKGFVSKDSEQKWEHEKRALSVQICSSLTVKVNILFATLSVYV